MWSSGSTNWYWIHALDDGKLLYEYLYSIAGTNYVYARNYMYSKVGPYRVFSENTNNIYLVLDNTYLATINNLGTPITKTADRTLKIVYTLTETS